MKTIIIYFKKILTAPSHKQLIAELDAMIEQTKQERANIEELRKALEIENRRLQRRIAEIKN